MNPKILLIGKTGQIGFELATLLPRIGLTVALDRQELDLLKPAEIRRVIREVRPQLIVNAAAYTAVDQAENDEVTARAINADAPAVLAEEARKTGAILIHYSTDYVFDGIKTSPYNENDPANPVNVYGRTKLEGEDAIRSIGIPHLILRTSWVYATRGKNFLLTILRLATQREELQIVSDQVGAPTWSRAVAEATATIIRAADEGGSKMLDFSKISGMYHTTAGGAANWCEFANAILEGVGGTSNLPWSQKAVQGAPIILRRIFPITTAQYLTPARRPLNSLLSNNRLNTTFNIKLPDWRAQLHQALIEYTGCRGSI
jgi:dTDP-4-dehydrorhamnose reductase